MKWFLNRTMRNKLFLGFGLKFALMIVVIATAYSGITSIQESQQRLYREDFADVRDLLALRSSFNGIRALMLEAQVLSTRSEQDPLVAQATERSKYVGELIASLLERSKNDPGQLSRLEELKSVWQAFAQTKDTEIIPLILGGKLEESRGLAGGVQEGRAQRVRAIAEELGKKAEADAQLAVDRAELQANQSFRVFTLVGIAVVVIGVLLALLMERVIAGPMRELSRAAERIAGGDLTVRPPADSRTDEVGDLARSFSAMVEKLRQTTREINEGVSVLASSSSEILATTTQVAAGAAETATAVSETTATVEEVKQTAQLASQKARYVSDSAQKAANVSQAGRTAAGEAVRGMHHIQEQMASIAESIVRLSEQSQAIGEIIATVSGLAEQSNLLAVNAAIEATRAGEQGRGFGVVAQEIKSLAEQSKQATGQVRTILGDIQKATAAAVLATEQGNKAVEAGVKQTGETGESIRVLSESINEAAQAATQIAASSQQQMVGMDQVALAMENIRQASTQNVAGTRQAEVAAHGLHELGQKLGDLIGSRSA